MRSALQSLFQAAPPTLSLAEFCQELVHNLQLPKDKVTIFEAHVQDVCEVTSTEELLKLGESALGAAVRAAIFDVHEIAGIRVCLGSTQCPYNFSSTTSHSHHQVAAANGNGNDDKDDMDDNTPMASLLSRNSSMCTPVSNFFKKEKGGTLKEVSQILQTRRGSLEKYHLPSSCPR